MKSSSLEKQTTIRHPWVDVLNENHVNFIALDTAHDSKLIKLLKAHPKWAIEFSDEDSIFFIREVLLNYN